MNPVLNRCGIEFCPALKGLDAVVLSLTPQGAIDFIARQAIELVNARQTRVAVGLVGGPGAGKSTIASEIVSQLNGSHGGIAALVPMDGFHMRHAKLEALGTAAQKGAPHTFEAAAFAEFLGQLKAASDPVSGPGYSRAIEDVVEDAFTVPGDARILVVEGNYLLLPDPPWDAVKPLLDLSVFVDVPRELVRERLLRRHAEHGLFSEERNIRHVDGVDLANFDLVSRWRDRADVTIALETES